MTISDTLKTQDSAVPGNEPPFPRNLLKSIRKWAATKPLEIELQTWAWIWGVALILAFSLYTVIIFWSFANVNSALLQASPAGVRFLKSQVDCSTPLAKTQIATDYAQVFAVRDEKTVQRLNEVICEEYRVENRAPSAMPALSLVERLVVGGNKCQVCEAECSLYWRDGVARSIAGTFVRDGDSHQSGERPAQTAEEACSGLKPSFLVDLADFRSLIYKPHPEGAPDIAKALIGTDACLREDDRERCNLVTRLVQSAVDNPDVRVSRTAQNMFWGWERLLVYWLGFVVAFALFYHWLARLNLERQKDWLINLLMSEPRGDLEKLGAKLKKTFVEEKEAGGTRPLTPVLDLTLAAAKDQLTDTHDELDARAGINTDHITKGRVAIDLLITLFPVIGFVATLWGLITALSSANLIASTQGDEKNAAVLHVTAELSSCFSTTLLALTLMTVFAIVNTLQAKKEIKLVTDPQYHLLRVLRPGVRSRQGRAAI